MNAVLQTLLNHRSIRKYTEQPIASDVLDLILKSACNGSTMGNMQLYSIIITQDKEMMKKMAPFHFHQPIATNAPLILTFCADFHRFDKFCEYRDAITDSYHNLQAYHWAFTDAIIAAQNACNAAESLGLGICWLGTITFNVDKFVDILQLPQNVIPLACISMGYPAEQPPLTDKLPVEALIHREIYHSYNKEDIDKLYKEKENHPHSLALYEENGLENLAKIITQKRYVKKDNEYFSDVLLYILKKQKFLK